MCVLLGFWQKAYIGGFYYEPLLWFMILLYKTGFHHEILICSLTVKCMFIIHLVYFAGMDLEIFREGFRFSGITTSA